MQASENTIATRPSRSADGMRESSTPNTIRVDLALRIETPENVVLTYQMAGPAIRLAAYLLDVGVRFVLIIVVGSVLLITGVVMPGASGGLLLIAHFLNEWFYFVVCEGFFKGKTVGKHVFGLRVIQEQGHPMTFWSAMLRNLVRAAESFPLYGPAFISMLCSRRFQRLGDLVARTVVIQERRVSLPREPIILEKVQPLPREELGGFVPDQRTLSLIDQFLGRRYVLTLQRGHVLASVLARPLADRLNYRGDPTLVDRYPMAFLARVYVTFVRREDEDDEYIRELRTQRRPAAVGAMQ